VERLRSAGIAVGVVSNQSGIARGLIDEAQVRSVNAEIERQLGAFGTWQVCPHGPGDGCACRKPQPGMVRAGAHALGVAPEECAVIGDIGADVLAARAAGARAVLVPTAATRAQEVRDAPVTAPDLATAVDLLLATRTGARRTGADRVSECEAGLG
jgi:histidinol-phosphate phosphatase family protein